VARARAITTEEEAVAALHEVAGRFGVSLDRLLRPETIAPYLRRSALLRNVLAFFDVPTPAALPEGEQP
jgi:hypothetical protein